MKQDLANKMTEQQKRLFDMTKQLGDCDCWVWQGQISNSGYGRLKSKDSDGQVKMMSAQAVSYQRFISAIPEGFLVKQGCGNRLCINPEHLELLKI